MWNIIAQTADQSTAYGPWAWVANLTALALVLVLFAWVIIKRIPQIEKDHAAERQIFLTAIATERTAFIQELKEQRDANVKMQETNAGAIRGLAKEFLDAVRRERHGEA